MSEISSLGVFFRDKGIFVFLPGEGGCRACNAYVYIQKIPYFHAFFDKIIFFHFLPKAKISYFLEKINIVFRREFPGKNIYPEQLKKISYFQVFFFFFFLKKIIFRFVSKNKIIFSGKRNIVFPDNTRNIFQCDFFWKDHVFKTCGKRKYGFSCSAI